MKNILIIYPHWPPSNLAGVHRPRLVANYLEEFGWKPIVLTVHPDYYEEEPDWDLTKTVAPSIEVHRVKAKPLSATLRLVGDIGLRAWFELEKKALSLIHEKNIDFIWIPIPSFYVAVLGRKLFNKTGVKYGIDYIDPWVRDISNRKNLRSVFSLYAAKVLEPYAVKKASLISGVSEAYYRPVLEKNFSGKPVKHLAFPYGFDPNDHAIKLNNIPVPWQEDGKDIKPFVYAGAFLPNSRIFVKALFKSIAQLVEEELWPPHYKFYFIGTGFYQGKSIQDYANEEGVGNLVKEDRERHPFLNILNWLNAAHVVMVLGSTEKHYTASKTFQAILSGKPLLAVFHSESSAMQVLKETNTESYTIPYFEGMEEESIVSSFKMILLKLGKKKVFWKEPDFSAIQVYSSSANAKMLAQTLNEIINEKHL